MTTDSETMEQYLNFVWTRFLISVLVFVSRDYELGRVSDSDIPVTELILKCLISVKLILKLILKRFSILILYTYRNDRVKN